MSAKPQGASPQGASPEGASPEGASPQGANQKSIKRAMRRARGLTWNNKNHIREFAYGSMLGQNTVNSNRPSQPGPNLVEPPLWMYNPIGPDGKKLRMPGVKQTMPVVPTLAKNNTRRNRNWALASSFMKQQTPMAAARPVPKTDANAQGVARRNEYEARLLQRDYEANPPPPLVNTGESWYKNVVPHYSLPGALPWPPAPRPRAPEGGKRRARRKTKRSTNHKK